MAQSTMTELQRRMAEDFAWAEQAPEVQQNPDHFGRLVAVCHANGVSHLLTFNTTHFARLAGFGPGVVVVHPTTV